jgi:hypothetical protein
MHKNLVVLLLSTLLVVSSCSFVSAKQTETKNQPLTSDETSIIEMINQINESLLFFYHHEMVKFGPRYTGSLNCSLAASAIYDAFQDMGLDVEFHDWSYDGFTSKDVVATHYGTDSGSTAEIIICGHYDTTVDSPGADDDASGTAAVLAIAHVLSNYQFNHTIRFIAFSGEEVGTYGSFTYAQEAYSRGDNIVAVLNMDMIGYAGSTEGGRVLRFFPPQRSHWIAEYATTISEKYMDYVDMTIETLPSYPGADNQAFCDFGYDGVWIAHRDGYQWGHSSNDTAEHLNWTYYVKATKLMLAVTAEFALKPLPIQVLLQSPYEGYLYLFSRPVLPAAFPKQWFTGLRGTTILLGKGAVARATVLTNEPIQYVIFCIDGKFISWDSEPPYEWTIQGMYAPIWGIHTLNVFAYTTSGDVASDEMDIRIYSLLYSYRG